MNALNLPSFVRTMQGFLVEHDGQEDAFNFLVDSINRQDIVLSDGYSEIYSSKRISRIMNYQSPIPDGIKQASSRKDVIDGVLRYFDNTVEPAVNPHLRQDAIATIIKLLDEDESVSDQKRIELKQSLDEKGLGSFLAHVFLYALNKPNELPAEVVKADDIALLAETNYCCPLCQKPLIENAKDKPVERYKITPILPPGLDKESLKDFAELCDPPKKVNSTKNLIALDADCSNRYLDDPTPEEYAHLMQLKTDLSRSYAASSAIDSIYLEEEIRTVVSSLTSLTNEENLTKLSYDALHVAEKMSEANRILVTQIQLQVVLYYTYIQKLFSDSGADFQLICSEVKTASRKLENSGLPYEEVINRLSGWFMNHAQLGGSSKQACDIVVAFFIQNCEVFSL